MIDRPMLYGIVQYDIVYYVSGASGLEVRILSNQSVQIRAMFEAVEDVEDRTR